MVEILYRAAMLEANGVDTSTGQARLSFSSELPVLRVDPKYGGPDGQYYERLSHAPGDVNLGLLNRAGVVLWGHDDKAVIGDVVRGSARVESDRKCRATIKLYPEFSPHLERMLDGKEPNQVSVGYNPRGVVRREMDSDGIPIIWFAWEPHEVSILSADREPADCTVGLGRSKNHMSKNSFDQILSLALSASRHTEIDFSEYSLAEALDFDTVPRGLVREAQAMAPKRIGGDYVTGRFIPFGALAPRRRDLTVSNFGQGGALVQSDMQPAVHVLYNRVAAIQRGCTVVSGLEGAFVLPLQTSATTVQALGEIAAVAQSGITFVQKVASPKRITIQVPVSRQMLVQNPAMDQFLREEFSSRIGVEVDRQIFNGNGGTECQGILQTSGIGSVVFGGAANLTTILAFEASLAAANADVGNLGWAISPSTQNKWKQQPWSSSIAFPFFLMQHGRVLDWPVSVTNNLNTNHQACFGAFSELLLLIWSDGIEVIRDDYTVAPKGEVLFTCHLWFNTVLRHAQSFAVSADPANQ